MVSVSGASLNCLLLDAGVFNFGDGRLGASRAETSRVIEPEAFEEVQIELQPL